MNTKAFVLDKEDYDKKLAEAANIFVDKNTKQPLPYVEVGKKLYSSMGCSQCHSINGSRGTGPTWKGLYKRERRVLRSPTCPATRSSESDDDKKWDDYLRESILHPGGQDRAGLPERHASPGVGRSSGSPYKEKKLQAIIEYIKSVGDPKYYKPMKTPELPSTARAAGEVRNAASRAAKPAGSRSLRRSTRGSADRQVETPSPAAKKEEGK